MATRIVIMRALAQQLGQDDHYPVTGVADDHTTTTLTDTFDSTYSSQDTNAFDRKWIYFEAVKNPTRVTEAGYVGSAGVYTVSPAVTDAPAAITGDASGVTTDATSLTDSDENMNTDEWIGYTVRGADGDLLDVTSNTATKLTGTAGWTASVSGPGAVVWTVGTRFIISNEPFAVMRDALNLVHTNMYEETLWPLSLHIMGNDANDMEPSTIATDYTAENSGTLATESTIVFNGAQSLKTTANGSGNSGATTGDISVYAGKPYYGAIMCSVQQADAAQFKAVNVQDSDAQIDDDATTDEPSWTELVIPITPPSGCEQVQFHMLATASADVAYWDDFQFWAAGTSVYPLPSWVTRPEQVADVRVWPRGTSGPAADFDWRADEKESVSLSWRFERGDRRADVPVRIVVANPGSNRPFVILRRDLGVLSTDTTTSPADTADVVRWVVRYVKAEDSEKADVLALLRSRYFPKSSTTLPVRLASGSGTHPHRRHYRHH